MQIREIEKAKKAEKAKKGNFLLFNFVQKFKFITNSNLFRFVFLLAVATNDDHRRPQRKRWQNVRKIACRLKYLAGKQTR